MRLIEGILFDLKRWICGAGHGWSRAGLGLVQE